MAPRVEVEPVLKARFSMGLKKWVRDDRPFKAMPAGEFAVGMVFYTELQRGDQARVIMDMELRSRGTGNERVEEMYYNLCPVAGRTKKRRSSAWVSESGLKEAAARSYYVGIFLIKDLLLSKEDPVVEVIEAEPEEESTRSALRRIEGKLDEVLRLLGKSNVISISRQLTDGREFGTQKPMSGPDRRG